MWVHYKFRHAVRWEKAIPITGSSITVADLERAIIAAELSPLKEKKKGLRCLANVRLLVFNAQTGEEYGGDNEEIPANTPVIVRLLTLWSKAFLESKRASQFKTQLNSLTIEGGCIDDIVIRARRPFIKSAWHYLKTPPGYVCHRCHVSGHYIQACPTNGDPRYDIKGSNHPTGVSKAKDAVSSAKKVFTGRFPKELKCPLCKEAMKEAVLMRCCFSSFCDKCIRDHIISRSFCACGARNVSLDDLIPNKTLRETIKRFMLLTSSDSGNDKSCCLQARGHRADHYSEAGVCVPTTRMEPAPAEEASRVSVAVSGLTVTNQCSGAAAPLAAPPVTESVAVSSVNDCYFDTASTTICTTKSAPIEEEGSWESLAVCSVTDSRTCKQLEDTPNVELQPKSNTMGSRKRVSSNEDASMIKLIILRNMRICIACVRSQGFVYIVLNVFGARKKTLLCGLQISVALVFEMGGVFLLQFVFWCLFMCSLCMHIGMLRLYSVWCSAI